MKIKYASSAFIKKGTKIWYEYLLTGFRNLGYEIEFSNTLTNMSFCELGKSITYLKIDDKLIIHDWSDFDLIHSHLPHDLYFKIQFKNYMEIPNVYPIGQTVCDMRYLTFLIHLHEQTQKNDIAAIFRTTNYDMRTKAVEIIQSMNIKSKAWCIDFPNRKKYSKAKPKINFEDHLFLQARSKICIAMPGVGGDWTWRHTEILGMNRCMIIPSLEYQYPGNHNQNVLSWVECARDLNDLQDTIIYLLEHDDERERIARNGWNYFVKYLSPEGQAKWILEKL